MVCVDVNKLCSTKEQPLGKSCLWIRTCSSALHPFQQACGAPRCCWVPLGFLVPLGSFTPSLE